MARGAEDYLSSMKLESNNLRLTNFIIIIPLNVPHNFPTDHIDCVSKLLLKRNLVVYFDYQHPVSLFTLVTNKSVRDRILHNIHGIARQNRRGAVNYNPLGVLPFQRIPWIRKMNINLGFLQIKIHAKLWKFKNVGIWGFHPIIANIVGSLNEQFSVYDCLDYYGSELKEGIILQTLEKKLLQSVTLACFCSKALYTIKRNQYPHLRSKFATYYPMGCNTQLFFKEQKWSRIGIPTPRIGMVGHINFRVNFLLL